MPSCSSTGLKVHLWATWIAQEFSDLNGAILRLRLEAGCYFCLPFPLSPPLLKGELLCFLPTSLQSQHSHPQPSAVF